jgi:hypothetical protein
VGKGGDSRWRSGGGSGPLLVICCLGSFGLAWSFWFFGRLRVLDEVIVSTMKHAGSEAAHDGARLHVQVSHHGVTLPPSEELDDVGIHLCAKQSHGAAGTEGSGGNILGSNAELVPSDLGSGA